MGSSPSVRKSNHLKIHHLPECKKSTFISVSTHLVRDDDDDDDDLELGNSQSKRTHLHKFHARRRKQASQLPSISRRPSVNVVMG